MGQENKDIHGLTIGNLAQFIKSNQGIVSNEDWLLWPPDVFALTSIIMQRTGCYRIALIEVNEDDSTSYWEDKEWFLFKAQWEDWLNLAGNACFKEITTWSDALLLYKDLVKEDLEGNDKEVTDILKNLVECWKYIIGSDITIDSLRTISTDTFETFIKEDTTYNESKDVNYFKTEKEKFEEIRHLAVNISKMHSLADEVCRGFGLISELDHIDLSYYQFNAKIADFARMAANFLLVSTGSLSTIPKFHGVVLPEMRTPQVGLVLRAASHHVTFHTTEVEVIWRTIPWLKFNERSLNIIAIPSPFKITDNDFKIIGEEYHSVRYFKPNLASDKVESADGYDLVGSVIDTVVKRHMEGTGVHMIIFPEMSLKLRDYRRLLNGFHDKLRLPELKGFKLPVIIAGVVSEVEEGQDKDPQEAYKDYFENEVRIANYFAGRWYDVKQRKHHRWQLDRAQIMQYNLQNIFPTERPWFEHTTISQRRLTILAPNSWLVLTALICEDLARLEPVSEVIRGIGPTFLTALLSDGPQLKERWSARYASVLADDPGSAVLTLTSYGMSKRSKPTSLDFKGSIPENNMVVGLWKDYLNGYKMMYTSGEKKALLMTISAEYKEEFTLDARSDGNMAAAFRLDGVKEIDLEETKGKSGTNGEDRFGNWEDIRQLSFFVFAIDSAISLLLINKMEEKDGEIISYSLNDCDVFWEKILGWLGMKKIVPDNDYDRREVKKYPKKVEKKELDEDDPFIKKLIYGSLENPQKIGVGVRSFEDWPTNEVKHAFSVATDIFSDSIKKIREQAKKDSGKLNVISIFEILFERSREAFNEACDIKHAKNSGIDVTTRRVRAAVPVCVVMTIDNKLSSWDIDYGNNLKNIKGLRKKIKIFLDESYSDVRNT